MCPKHCLVEMVEHPVRIGGCGIFGHRVIEYVTGQSWCNSPWTELRCSRCGDSGYHPTSRMACLWVAFFGVALVIPVMLVVSAIRIALRGWRCNCPSMDVIYPMTREKWDLEIAPGLDAQWLEARRKQCEDQKKADDQQAQERWEEI